MRITNVSKSKQSYKQLVWPHENVKRGNLTFNAKNGKHPNQLAKAAEAAAAAATCFDFVAKMPKQLSAYNEIDIQLK